MTCPHCGRNIDTSPRLSPREAQVLALMKAGILGTAEIASSLGLKPRTVKDYLHSIFRVTGMTSRMEFAVALAAPRHPLPAMGPRLRQVAEMIITGKPYQQIAVDLNLSPNVVKVYAKKILDLTGADDRVDLAARFK